MTDLVTAARQYETGDAALIQLLGALADEIERQSAENARLMHDIEVGAAEIERLVKLSAQFQRDNSSLLSRLARLQSAADVAGEPRPCGDGCKGCSYCRQPSDTPPERANNGESNG